MNKINKLMAAAWDLIRYRYVYTGERVNPHIPNENFVNHRKVYRFAAQFCAEKIALDIGCGLGYGTEWLARFSKLVIGIDYSEQALRFARQNYRRENLTFKRMNAETLEFPDRTFDFIISTENFEHLHDQGKAAQEMARVVKSAGLCLLATPNPEAFAGRAVKNRFHTHECTFDELQQTFSGLFNDVVILENQLSPRLDRGIVPNGPLFIFGQPVSADNLSNTHSFFCFLKGPKVIAKSGP